MGPSGRSNLSSGLAPGDQERERIDGWARRMPRLGRARKQVRTATASPNVRPWLSRDHSPPRSDSDGSPRTESWTRGIPSITLVLLTSGSRHYGEDQHGTR